MQQERRAQLKISISLDQKAINRIGQAAHEAAKEALEAVYSDLKEAETMPFDTGDMQNNSTFVEPTEGGAALITGSPQARRLYYHPEYSFQQGKNHNAGAFWLEPYISGEKKELVTDEYVKAFKRRSGV